MEETESEESRDLHTSRWEEAELDLEPGWNTFSCHLALSTLHRESTRGAHALLKRGYGAPAAAGWSLLGVCGWHV